MRKPIPETGRWQDGTLVERTSMPSEDANPPLEVLIEIGGEVPVTFSFITEATDLLVDWGDNSSESVQDLVEPTEIEHEYDPGLYTIKLSGYAKSISFDTITAEVIKEVRNGLRAVYGINTCKAMFRNCTSLTKVSNTLLRDISQNITDMSEMFSGATYVIVDTSTWDTSNVENMFEMFYNCRLVKPKTGNWNTSKVTNMSYMFYGAWEANPNVTGWDTSNVTDMSWMFTDTRNATPQVRNWDVGSVVNMEGMFAESIANPDVTIWDVSGVTNMSAMFRLAIFAAPVVTAWDVGACTDMSDMFRRTELANPDIRSWDMSNVTTVVGMFWNAIGMRNPVPRDKFWDVFTVLNTYENCFVGAPNISNRRHIPYSWGGPGFQAVINYALPESFTYSILFTDPNNMMIDWGDGSPVEYKTGAVNQTYSHVYTTGGTYTVTMAGIATRVGFFTAHAARLIHIPYPIDPSIKGLNSCLQMFEGCVNLNWICRDFLDDASVNVNNMSRMFNGATLAKPNTRNWNTSNVTNMSLMFFNAHSANPDVSLWNTSKVENMGLLFRNARLARPDVKNWDTSSVKDMSQLFESVGNQLPISNTPVLDLRNWDTSQVTTMSRMFAWNDKPIIFGTDNWNVEKVQYMDTMFAYVNCRHINVTNWQTLALINVRGMFEGCLFGNPNVSNWSVSTVQNFQGMFVEQYPNSEFNPDISNWNMSSATNVSNMFKNNDGIKHPVPPNLFWNRATHLTPIANFQDFALNAPNIANRNEIPSTWGGGLQGFQVEVEIGAGPDSMFAFVALNAVNLKVYWGDGTAVNYNEEMIIAEKIYATPGIKVVQIFGTADHLIFGSDNGTPLRVKRILTPLAPGVQGIISCESMFAGCENLTDIPANFLQGTDVNVTNMDMMFFNCKLLNPDVSNWNTSNVTRMSNMFSGCDIANPDVSNWNMSNVVDMSYMFNNCPIANPDVSNWDTGNAEDMCYMFNGTIAANPDVSNWDVSKVSNFSYMFNQAEVANPYIMNWQMTSATNVTAMFKEAYALSNPVPASQLWENINIVSYDDCFFEAKFCYNFYQVPEDWGGPDGLSIGLNSLTEFTFSINVDDLEWAVIEWGDDSDPEVFAPESPTNTVLSHIFADGGMYTAKIKGRMSRIAFNTGSKLNIMTIESPIGFSIKGLTSCDDMFNGCANITYIDPGFLNQPSTHIVSMYRMFKNSMLLDPEVTLDVTSWDTSSLEDATEMFSGCTHVDIDPSNWFVGNLKRVDRMFENAEGMTFTASPEMFWDNPSIYDHEDCFKGATNLANYDDIPKKWGGTPTFRVKIYYALSEPFTYSITFVDPVNMTIDWGDGSEPEIKNNAGQNTYSHVYADGGTYFVKMSGQAQRISFWTSHSARVIEIPHTMDCSITGITSLYGMFQSCTNLVHVCNDFIEDTSHNVTNMMSIFRQCPNVVVNTSNWDTSKVTDMRYMFNGTRFANPNVSEWDVGEVLRMDYMFYDATAAQPQVGNWNTSKCTNMETMFEVCGATYLDVENWDVSNVTSFGGMFSRCPIVVDVSKWNVSKCTRFLYMFSNNTAVRPDVKNWVIGNEEGMSINMQYMFRGAISANPDITGWNMTRVTNVASMLEDAINMKRKLPSLKFWNRVPAIASFAKFAKGAFNIENYRRIPNNWKGL